MLPAQVFFNFSTQLRMNSINPSLYIFDWMFKDNLRRHPFPKIFSFSHPSYLVLIWLVVAFLNLKLFLGTVKVMPVVQKIPGKIEPEARLV